MTGLVYGEEQDVIERRAGLYNAEPEELIERGLVVGGPQQVIDRLGEFADAGAERIMLQWLDTDHLAGLEHFASNVLPHIHK